MGGKKKVIKNGMVFSGGIQGKYDIVIDEMGKVEEVVTQGQYEETGGEEVTDAKGLFIVPGGVDAHVHLDYSMGDIKTTDGFYDGTKAALAGGTTTIIDFCQPIPGQDAKECIRARKNLAAHSVSDYAFHFIFTEEYKKQLRQIEEIRSEGIGSFKAYTTYDHITLNRGDLKKIMEKIGGQEVLMVHAEADDLIKAMVAEKEEENTSGIMELFWTRPNLAEELAVSDLAILQKETGTKVCIAHTSTKEAVEIKNREIKSGNEFYLETCPHYLAYTKEIYRTEEGGLYAMNPPLKGEEDRKRLWMGILDGSIDLLSTDHCPFNRKQKLKYRDYRMVPCGLGGLQMRMQYLFSEGVKERGLTMKRFVELTSENAAKIYKLYPKKGRIGRGSDGDLVFIDPNTEWTYTKKDFVSRCDYDIFENRTFKGKIVKVMSRGETVYEEGKVTADEGRGKYIGI